MGHSRAMYADATTGQKLETFLRLHEAAFEALGGVPKEMLYDHIETVVVGTDKRWEVCMTATRIRSGYWSDRILSL